MVRFEDAALRFGAVGEVQDFGHQRTQRGQRLLGDVTFLKWSLRD